MNPDERIEAALRRRPSDERDYDEPLRDGARAGVGARRRSAVPVLLAACLALVIVGVGGVFVASRLSSSATSGYQLPSPSGPLVTCWQGSRAFPASLLQGEGSAEKGDSAAAKALRLLLADRAATDLPRTGWHVVYATADDVEFVATGSANAEVDVRRVTQGQWTVDGWSVVGYGGCQLQAIPSAGYGPASWVLDPAASLGPDSTEVHILVTEQSCASGRTPPIGEIRAEVVRAVSAVTVTVTVRDPPGDFQNCQGNPSVPFVVELGEPLGSRALFDGGSWPPVQRAAAGRPIVTPSPSAMATVGYTVQAGETVESIANRLHFDVQELQLANPGVDLSKLETGQQIGLPWAHWPTDCSGDIDMAASFFKAAAAVASFDVYCAVLPDGWSVESNNQDKLDGASPAGVVQITYKGPNGESLSLRQGKFGEAAGAAVKRLATIGPAKLADRDATLCGSNGSYSIFTPPEGTAMWEIASTGLTQEQFVALAASLILVGK